MNITDQTLCLQLQNKSNKELSDESLVRISYTHELPLAFLVDMRKYNTVWFNIQQKNNFITIEILAYCRCRNKILDWNSDLTVSQEIKNILATIKPLRNPKNSIIVDPQDLEELKNMELLNEVGSISRMLDYSEKTDVRPTINWKEVICLEIRNYNSEYLLKISDKLGIRRFFLPYLKEKDVVKVYWDMTRPYFLAYQLRDAEQYSNEVYKGLVLWNSVYNFMTKKDKDRLLRMKSVDIKKLIQKDAVNSVHITNAQEELGINDDQEQNVDKILEKITKYGIDSLTSEERKFLDDESKKED